MVVKVKRNEFTILVSTVMAFSSDVTLVVKDGRCGFSNFDSNLYSHLSIDIACESDEDCVVCFDPAPLMQFLKLVHEDDIQILVNDKVVVSSSKQRVSIAKYLPRENKPGIIIEHACEVRVPSSEFIDTMKVATGMGGTLTLMGSPGQVVAKIGDDAANTIEYEYTIENYVKRPEKMAKSSYMCDLLKDMTTAMKEFDILLLSFSGDAPIIISGASDNLNFKLLVANKIGAT